MNEPEKKIKAISEYVQDKAKNMPESPRIKSLSGMDELTKTLLLLAEVDVYNGIRGKFENEFLKAIVEIGDDAIVERGGTTAIRGGAARILLGLIEEFSNRYYAGEDTTDLFEYFISEEGDALSYLAGTGGREGSVMALYAAVKNGLFLED